MPLFHGVCCMKMLCSRNRCEQLTISEVTNCAKLPIVPAFINVCYSKEDLGFQWLCNKKACQRPADFCLIRQMLTSESNGLEIPIRDMRCDFLPSFKVIGMAWPIKMILDARESKVRTSGTIEHARYTYFQRVLQTYPWLQSNRPYFLSVPRSH